MTPVECVFENTSERKRYRRRWGERAGKIAYYMSVPRDANPFVSKPYMPMHSGWNAGWDAAENTEAAYPHEMRTA